MQWARLIWGGSIALCVMAGSACAKGTGATDLGDDESDAAVDEGGVSLPKDSGGKTDSGTPVNDGGGGCSGHVVLNEVQTEGNGGATDEFVELYNPTGCKVSLGGWKIQYSSANGSDPGANALYSFGSAESIEPNAFLLIGSGKIMAGMAKSDGQVGLVDDASKVIDGVAYGSITKTFFREGTAAPSPPTKGSIGRKSNGVDTDDNSDDWKTYASPTPGASN